MPKISCIIQARTQSKRFPNKILKKIKNLTILDLLILRLKKSKAFSQIIVATSKNKKDKKIIEIAKRNKVSFFIGDEKNVLKRYYDCANKFNLENIIRITSDCPLVDVKLIDQMTKKYFSLKVDYLSNVINRTYPDGLDIEIFSGDILKQAFKYSKTKFEKEHVTQYLIKNTKIKKYNFINNNNYSKKRWTLDYYKDFLFISSVFEFFKKKIHFGMNEILKNEKLILKIYDNKLDELYEKNSNKGYKIWQKALSIIPDGNMLLSKRPDNFLPFGWPTYYKNAKGYKITDLQGNSLSDFSYMGVGTNILGYSNAKIDNYVIRKIKSSISTTLNSKEDFILAEKLIEINSDWAEMVKLTRTGAEASSVAIRISRAATGKSKVIICGYHGWQDWYLSSNLKDNSNLDNHLIKNLNINGVPKELERTTYQFQYNDINSLKKILDSDKDIGTLIMEVKRNINPTKGFLHKVRSLCNKYGVVLIFDECTSGFRENYGGLHKFFKVNPDICIYGKALGNGYPINAVVGKRYIMEHAKKSFISSTFWTEGMGPAAAIRTLEIFKKEQSWKYLIDYGKKIKKLWSQLSNTYNLKLEISGLNAIPIFNFNSSYHPKYKTFLTQEMLKKNILATNAVYISTKHDKSIFDKYAINLDKIFFKISECINERENIDNLLEYPTSMSKIREKKYE